MNYRSDNSHRLEIDNRDEFKRLKEEAKSNWEAIRALGRNPIPGKLLTASREKRMKKKPGPTPKSHRGDEK